MSVTPASLAHPEPLFPSRKNPLALDFPIKGSIFGQSHWEEVLYEFPLKNAQDKYDTIEAHGLIDKSLLDSNKSGETYIYGFKPCQEHYGIVVTLTFPVVIPLYIAGVILYNVLRIIPVIGYLTVRIFYDYFKKSNRDLGKEKLSFKAIAGHHLKEMGKQVWLSIANIIRTPFYALGFLFGVLYAWVDPWNGRKVAASFERSWNHNMMRNESIWCHEPKKHFHFEGGGDPEKLGHHAYYLPGCYQPSAIAVFEKGELKEIKGFSGKTTYEIKSYQEVNDKKWNCMPLGCKV